MATVPELPRPLLPLRPWWMTAIVVGQHDNARLPLSHLGSLPRGAIVLSLANYFADTAATAEADPGSGNLRWNHATQSSATEIYLDDDDADAEDHAALWAGLSPAGFLYLYNPDNLDVWQQWQITAVDDEAGYLKLAVTYQGGAGSFADDDAIVVTIQQPNPPAGVDRNVVTVVSSVSGTTTLDASLGDYFRTTLTENTTVAISNWPQAGTLKLRITQSNPARTVAWPGTWDWGKDVTAAVMATGNGDELDVFISSDDSGASALATARPRA